ncbi:hypothetical protein T4B_3903 [Trichinella pseudospiralis]|uniref:Uncharacterized protein n=1 Tax=Trichinella pseudospiralis TaxID=6337 RepID=A0A0V1JE13_TRIPS|nr:hypothetical protein T4B_3903 [Trichinella pseudospiralis]
MYDNIFQFLNYYKAFKINCKRCDNFGIFTSKLLINKKIKLRKLINFKILLILWLRMWIRKN